MAGEPTQEVLPFPIVIYPDIVLVFGITNVKNHMSH
jgi:hypothetical protein